MPHQTRLRKFGRPGDHRRAMLRNLSLSVLRYERVKTTEAKAKEVRRFVDRMINLGKDGTLAARRQAAAWLPEPVIVEKVFTDLAQRYPDRRSGYLHLTRLPRRVGDAAPLMQLELVAGVDTTKAEAPTEEQPRRRRLALPGRRAKTEAAGAEASPRKRATKTTARTSATTRGKASSKEG